MANSAFTVTGTINAPAPAIARAWGYFTVSAGVYTLQASYNVAGIAKISTGIVQINLATHFASNFYAFAFGGQSAGNNLWQTEMQNQLAGSFQMAFADATGFHVDPAAGSFICFGN